MTCPTAEPTATPAAVDAICAIKPGWPDGAGAGAAAEGGGWAGGCAEGAAGRLRGGGDAGLIPPGAQARGPRGQQPLALCPPPSSRGWVTAVLHTGWWHPLAPTAPAPPLRWRRRPQGHAIAPLESTRFPGLLPQGPGPALTWRAGRPRCGSLEAWSWRWGPAELTRDRNAGGGDSGCATDATPLVTAARGAGPRGHAPRGGAAPRSRGARAPPAAACPPLSAAVSAGSTTPRPPCACPPSCVRPGDGSQGRRAQRVSRGDREAQGTELGAVRCYKAEDAERRPVEAGLGGGTGRRPGRAPLAPIGQGLRTSVWSQGHGGGDGGPTRAAKRCQGEGLAGPESRSAARGRPEPVFDSFLAKTRCRQGQPRTAPPGVR